MRDRLRRVWQQIYQRLFERRTDGETAPPTDQMDAPSEDSHREESDVSVEYDPETLENREDVLSELGLSPREFVVRLLEEQEGQIRQQAFTDYTDWSEATISRLLQEMEENGEIVRIQIGRENVICLPDEMPINEPSDATGSGDTHKV